ncbi:hypothetical protein CNMCM5623_001563 [Aspergillus felis]|uniref:Methyltransferase n=1 Tax=Aspergillus felis TaxID=1287682 RepID=A0A8H6Q8Q9_9EURO|nr:hypothetical protein CNMCM5623_001563 [Aspergillus felis]
MAILTQYSTQMGFIVARAPSDKPPFYRSAAGEGFEVSNFSHEQHTVSVSDARPVFDSFNLDTHGFAFAVDPEGTRPEILEAIRAGDKETVRLLYYPVVEELVKRQTQASRVVIFDHTVRRREAALAGKNPNGREQPASTVHCDHVWRPLNGPVQDWPLAMMDCTTLAKASIHPTQLYRNRFELRGETVSISHRKDQRWYYLDRQKTDEITFIKIWDSKEGVSGYMCAHCAFQHPDTPEDAPLRESVEVRCLVFYDDEA